MGLGGNSGFHAVSKTACLLFLLLLVQKGYSLSCWECNSKYDPNCADPFTHYTLAQTDCSQRHLQHYPNVNATICRKIVQKVEGKERVIRGCGFVEPDGQAQCVNRAGTHGVFVYYCQCDNGDGCNTAVGNFKYSKWSSLMFAMFSIGIMAKF